MPTTRRRFLKSVASAVMAGPAVLGRAKAGTRISSALNIVMIVADDQRHDTIAALGNPIIQTPNLDRLVKEGFTFTNARCMGSTQGAVCVPSRASLHTGRMLFAVPDDMGDHPTIGQSLLKAGYDASASGKWHNRPKSFARSFNAGANLFFNGMDEDQFKVPVSGYSAAGIYPGKTTVTPGKFSSELFTDPAVEMIRRRKPSDRPFFYYLAFTSPHDPRTPPPQFKAMYSPEKMPLPRNFMPRHPFDNGDMRVRDELLAPLPRTADDTRRQLCDYYGMISAQDQQVGRVIEAIHESGQADRTLIVYTGDHGLAIGSHGLFGKQNVYEHSTRIPLLMSGPGIHAGKQSDALVYGFDLFPTLCELTGVQTPDSVQGKSLAKVIAGTADRVRDSAFNAYTHRAKNKPLATQYAIRDERWKLIRYQVDGAAHQQLFDLQTDPDEMHDLSADAVAAKNIPRLDTLMKSWAVPA